MGGHQIPALLQLNRFLNSDSCDLQSSGLTELDNIALTGDEVVELLDSKLRKVKRTPISWTGKSEWI